MFKIIMTTFWIVFISELGDKTQLQTMLLATQSKSIWPVFLGSALALILSSFCAVCLSTVLTKYIPTHYLQTGAGVVFIVIGVLTLFGRM